MTCGCPVLAANGGATPEILADSGLYFEPADVDGCAAQIARLVDNSELRSTLISKGLERSKLCSILRNANC
jgi:glycosyltransferase involved in cell wall biosynthesis